MTQKSQAARTVQTKCAWSATLKLFGPVLSSQARRRSAQRTCCDTLPLKQVPLHHVSVALTSSRCSQKDEQPQSVLRAQAPIRSTRSSSLRRHSSWSSLRDQIPRNHPKKIRTTEEKTVGTELASGRQPLDCRMSLAGAVSPLRYEKGVTMNA